MAEQVGIERYVVRDVSFNMSEADTLVEAACIALLGDRGEPDEPFDLSIASPHRLTDRAQAKLQAAISELEPYQQD